MGCEKCVQHNRCIRVQHRPDRDRHQSVTPGQWLGKHVARKVVEQDNTKTGVKMSDEDENTEQGAPDNKADNSALSNYYLDFKTPLK